MFDCKRCGVVILAVLMASTSYGVTVRDFENRTFTGSTGDTLRYRLFVPKDYDSSRPYPIVICLSAAPSVLVCRLILPY